VSYLRTTNNNQLEIYRRRMRLSAKQVANLLGHRGTSALLHYERGSRLPSLKNALKLGAILRVPLEFIFPSLYDYLRQDVRFKEESLIRER